MRVSALHRVALVAAALLGCGPAPAGPELGFKVQALSGEGLPREVAKVRVTWKLDNRTPTTREATIDQLEQSDGKTRLSIERIPENTPIEVTVEGVTTADRVAYAGTVGPLTLAKDEQLRVHVVLYNRDDSELVPGDQPPGRFLHTATRLVDGRVLIAGGFGAPEAGSCPDGVADGSLCFDVSALDDAWLFDPTSATFAEVASGLLGARGGHTATRLPDGRVLVAGGASRAKVVLAKSGAAYEPYFVAVDPDGAAKARADFELFDPSADDDAARHDPARGRFEGPPGAPTAPGPLETARFLHAAAAHPLAPGRVLLAGGTDLNASETYEVFDAARSGGPGILPDSVVALSVPRTLPGAIPVGEGEAGWVWLVGGAQAHSNDELAERWFSNDTDTIGFVKPATESAFPNAMAGDDTVRPTYAFLRPVALPLAGGAQAIVTGGLGPRCNDAGTPVFVSDAATVPCSTGDTLLQGYVVEASTGKTTRIKLATPHILGAGDAMPDGRGAVSGGFLNLGLSNGDALHIVAVDAGLTALARKLAAPRALHTTTSFGTQGLVTVGGLIFQGGALELVASNEVIWL